MKFGTIGRFVVPVFVIITMFIGGLLYWLGGKAFGGNGGYLQNVSVFAYSGLPPLVVSLAASLIVIIFKDPDTIDIAASQRGLITASPAVLMDGHAMPVITTLVGTLDLFFIWGWILAAIGLRIVNKISSSSAWTITIIFAVIGVAFRIFGAYTGGAAQ